MRQLYLANMTRQSEIVLFTDGRGAYRRLSGREETFLRSCGEYSYDPGSTLFWNVQKLAFSLFCRCEKPEIGELQLNPEGSDFRLEVWQSLQNIPYGKLISYGDIAREIAIRKGSARMFAQAVGGAVGHNPLAIIIPCHRVIGHNGNLTGYGGGIAIKIWLLRHEGIDVSRLSMPKTRPLRANLTGNNNENCPSSGGLWIGKSL